MVSNDFCDHCSSQPCIAPFFELEASPLFFAVSEAKLFVIRWQRWIELTVKNSGNSVWRASSRF